MDGRSEKFLNIYDLVDAALATDPNALQNALTMMTSSNAVTFYREECRKHEVGPIQSFCRQIHGNAAFLDFSNHYFGARGILPVVSTLQHLAVVELRFFKCDLSADDVIRLHQALMSHPTLTSLDLRGNLLSLPSARKLLSLAIQNRRLTTLAVDDNVPKSILIQRQCLTNANVAVNTSACVICQKSMVHSVTGNVESKIFLALKERISTRILSLSAAEVETLFRSLLACADVNDGVLFLCSLECVNTLADNIVEAMRIVTNECVLDMRHQHHHHPVIARCIVELLEVYNSEPMPKKFFVVEGKRQGDPREEDWVPCTLCGKSCVPLTNGASTAVEILCRDISKGAVIRPSAFPRVIHTILRYSRMTPCGRKCVRHVVRHGITGYGGVIRSNPDPSDPLLSSIDVPLTYLPSEDFCVLNFAEVQVLDHGEEDTTCAVTVASLMSDIDAVAIDPYIIFAVGRFLSRRSSTVFGMELRQACEAVRVVGCLATDRAPFHRKNRPPRSAYVEWQKWSAVANVEQLQRLCFARRRQAVYLIDGPLDNAFDRIRAALWAFREQQRCAVVVIKFCLQWLEAEKGVIKPEWQPKGGFYTTVKVLGQTQLHNSDVLILQPNFGNTVGNHGFFYVPKSIFNRSIRGGAYMFVDTTSIRENQGIQPKQHFLTLVSPSVARVLDNPSKVYDVVSFLGNVNLREAIDTSQMGHIQQILSTMPPSMLFAFLKPGHRVPFQFAQFRAKMVQLFESSRGTTQLAFLWNEILGESAAKWITDAGEVLAAVRREARAPSVLSESNSSHVESIAWCATPQRMSPTPPSNSTPVSTQLQHHTSVAKPHPPTQASSSFGRDQNQVVDPAKAAMERALQMEREEQKMLQQLSYRSALSWDPKILGLASNPTERPFAAIAEIEHTVIPAELIGARWCAVNVPDELGFATSKMILFVKDYMAEYDCVTETPIAPLRRMSDDLTYSGFPFATGFDCSFRVHDASKPQSSEVYFFSEQTWIRWDVRRKYCVTGPHSTGVHCLFRSLPSEYHQRVDGAIEVRDSSSVLLFSYLQYVLFDVAQGTVLKKTALLSDPTGSCYRLSQIFPQGPMFSVSLSIRRQSQRTAERVQLMVGFDGSVAWFSCCKAATNNDVEILFTDRSQPIFRSCLAGLPSVFLQQSTIAASSIVDAMLEAVPRNKLCGLQLFTPISQPLDIDVSTVDNSVWDINISSTLSTSISPSNSSPSLSPSSQAPSAEITTPQPAEKNPNTPLSKLLELIDPFSGDSIPMLMRSAALLWQTEQSLDCPKHRIDFDFGIINSTSFAYVQMFFDVSMLDFRLLLIAPLQVSVQCSEDGICYTQVTVALVSSGTASAYWGAVHTARFWRLEFIHAPPLGLGVVRVLWHKARWVVDSSPYDPSEVFVPSGNAAVWVDAPVLLRPATELLVDIAPLPVFNVPKDDAWFARHAILPILPDGDTCLFFCGDVFVEYDFKDEHCVSSRCVAIAQHPSLQSLPFPFQDGIDAAFYPDVRDPSKVIFIHDEKLIVWDMVQGCACGPVQDFAESKYFKGLPFPVTRLSDVINIWEYPGHVFVFSELKIIRWNVLDASVVEGPFIREQIPVFNVPQFATQPYLAVTSFPGETKTFFIFCGSEVVESTIRRDHKIIMKPPEEFKTSDFFCSVARFLTWGETRKATTVSFDFKDRLPLAMGITVRSSDGCNPGTEWKVEYSDDTVSWKCCANHIQSVPRSTSTWHLKEVGGVAHRFWRLTSVPGTTSVSNGAIANVVYSQVLFHVLPVSALSCAPTRVSFTGKSCGTPSSLLSGSFSMVTSVATSKQHPQTLFVDFGNTPIEVCGLSYDSVDSAPSDMWVVSYSRDGTTWQPIGMWRIGTALCYLSWAPMYPQRYWKFDLISSSCAKEYSAFTLYESSAPSMVTNEGSDVRHLATVLHPKLRSDSFIDFKAAVGSTISVDFKQAPQALVGVAVAICVDSFTFMTSLEIEFSDDAESWSSVGTLVSCDEFGNAAWESEGSHRFWRLRVSKHYGAKTVRIQRIELSICGPMLYRQHKRHLVEVEPAAFRLQSGAQVQFVGVNATLPPASLFVVERLDRGDWVRTSYLGNFTDLTSDCTIGWPIVSPCAEWRLRLAGAAAPVGTPENVMFVSYSGVVENAAVLPDIVTRDTTGFDESQNAGGSPMSMTASMALEKSSSHPFSHKHSMKKQSSSADADLKKPVSGVFEPVSPKQELNLTSSPGAHDCIVQWNFSQQQRSPMFSSVFVFVNVQRVLIPQQANNSSVANAPDQIHHEPSPIEVLVEVSDDAEFFIPIAHAKLQDRQSKLLMSWHAVVTAPYWRLRFTNIPLMDVSLQLVGCTWLYRSGSSSFPSRETEVVLSSSFQHRWFSSASRGSEQILRTKVYEGMQEVDAVSTGLREPNDIDVFGQMTQPLAAWQKSFQKHMVRRIKENKDLQTAQAGRGQQVIGVDVSIILDTLTTTQSPMFQELLRLATGSNAVSSKIVVQELKLMKDSVSWCGPKCEYRGVLTHPGLFGFLDIPFSFSLRWALTPSVLRNRSVHLAKKELVQEAVCTPMLSLYVNRHDWFAGTAFPNLPGLYEFGFSERSPTAVVLTLKDISFYPPQIYFIPPQGTPFTTNFPYTFYRGINFAAVMKLKDCLSPVISTLQQGLPPHCCDKPQLVILTAPSVESRRFTVRFTCPGTGLTFGIPRLSIVSINIEIEVNLNLPLLQRRRVSFLVEDATLGMGESVLPVTLIGTFLSGIPAIQIRGHTVEGKVDNPVGLARAELHSMEFTVETALSDGPMSYVQSGVALTGTLCTACGLTFPARTSLTHLNNPASSAGTLDVDLRECSFATLVRFAAFLSNSGEKMTVEDWMEDIPFHITATLRVYPKKLSAKATGVVTFYGQSGRIVISMTPTGVHMSFTLPSLRLGGLVVLGSAATNGHVLIEASCPIGSVATIRLDGLCKTLSSSPSPSQIEISAAGTLCISTGAFFDVCVRDDSLFPIAAYATVSVSRDSFVGPLSNALRSTSMISTLLSHGLPFSFGVYSVSVQNCALERQSMQLTFRGVLFGYRFDVTTTVCSPDNSIETIEAICGRLASHIIEQCNESLWSSLDTFVGFLRDVDTDEEEGEEGGSPVEVLELNQGADMEQRSRHLSGTVTFNPKYQKHFCAEESKTARRHIRARDGTFIAQWAEKEMEYVDELLRDSDPCHEERV